MWEQGERKGLWESLLVFWKKWPVGKQHVSAGARLCDIAKGGEMEDRRGRSMGSTENGNSQAVKATTGVSAAKLMTRLRELNLGETGRREGL